MTFPESNECIVQKSDVLHAVNVLKFAYVLALYGPAGEELTTEPPRMQPGLGPSVHMELKNLLRHRQRGQANNTGACEDLFFSPKMGCLGVL